MEVFWLLVSSWKMKGYHIRKGNLRKGQKRISLGQNWKGVVMTDKDKQMDFSDQEVLIEEGASTPAHQEVVFEESASGGFQNSFHYREQFKKRQKSSPLCCGVCLVILVSLMAVMGFAAYGLYNLIFGQ